ncbi:hypothetical protein LZ30DRAFT_769516 [Colletotrichum cereale]|nr:hypothetical protein LZ30DRAFT_769516 [Colletotrichum cereale]
MYMGIERLRRKPAFGISLQSQNSFGLPFQPPMIPEQFSYRASPLLRDTSSIEDRNVQDRQQIPHKGGLINLRVGDVDSKFPLLRYATLCWVQHTYASFHIRYRSPKPQAPLMQTRPNEMRSQKSVNNSERSRFNPPAWIPFLSRFLFCRSAVTNWTESSFHYRWTPSLKKIMTLIQELSSDVPQDTPENREFHWISMGLGQLAVALDELAQKHRVRLLDNSTLIWQRDIISATDPAFWPIWAEEVRADAEAWLSGCWTGESFVPGQTLRDLAPLQNDFSKPRG